MGREVKRVALDFDWPLDEVWKGYIDNPYYQYQHDCVECNGSGYSKEALHLHNQWYGNARFSPIETNSELFGIDNIRIRQMAIRNVFFLRNGIDAKPTIELFNETEKIYADDVEIETLRLCRLFNGCWMNHPSQEDVDVLWENNRLHGFKEKPTLKEVGEWSLWGMHMDSSCAWYCIKAKCERLGISCDCAVCNGEGGYWDKPEYKQLAEDWKNTEPPEGPGYQIWETVSEGSPISPVFKKPEDLARWMVDNSQDKLHKDVSYECWLKFIKEDGWAPSLIMDSAGLHSGVSQY